MQKQKIRPPHLLEVGHSSTGMALWSTVYRATDPVKNLTRADLLVLVMTIMLALMLAAWLHSASPIEEEPSLPVRIRLVFTLKPPASSLGRISSLRNRADASSYKNMARLSKIVGTCCA